MRFANRLKYNGLITTGLALFVILNISINVLTILSDTFYYRGLLLIELFLVAYLVVVYRKINTNKFAFQLIFVIIVIQLLAYLFTFFIEPYKCFDIHRLGILILMFITLFFVPQYAYITRGYFEKLLTGIILLAVVASLYNILKNWSILSSFSLTQIMYHTSQFTSFFNSRSNFCFLLCIACAICISRLKEKKSLNWIVLCFFIGNIILTNARTSIIIMILLIIFEGWKTIARNNKKVKLFIGLIFFGLLLSSYSSFILEIEQAVDNYSLLFTRGDDFSNGRFQLAAEAWKNTNIISFFIGHGIGSKDAYLTYIGSSIYSFHSIWIDLFFEGGLFFLLLYFCFSLYVIRIVRNSELISSQKSLIYNFFFIVLFAGWGDAIATPFLLDTSSILSTLLLFTCPLTLINGIKLEKEAKKL